MIKVSISSLRSEIKVKKSQIKSYSTQIRELEEKIEELTLRKHKLEILNEEYVLQVKQRYSNPGQIIDFPYFASFLNIFKQIVDDTWNGILENRFQQSLVEIQDEYAAEIKRLNWELEDAISQKSICERALYQLEDELEEALSKED